MAGYKGHLRGGYITTIILAFLVVPSLPVASTLLNIFILIVSTLLGSLLPDIDHPNSMLGHLVPFISKPLNKHCGHRSLTHSILFIVSLTLILHLLGFEVFALGLGAGMVSHVLLDLFWPGSRGVAFLYPFYKRRIDLTPNISFKKKRRKKRKR